METLSNLMSGSGQKLYRKAKKMIPGGTQLLSKRPEMFAPDVWPAYYSKAKGVTIWDLDGRQYTDMSIMGIGAVILGYADEDVDAAVIAAIHSGVASTLNCPEEVELAEIMIDLHPWAQMVRYARCGGEAMSMAVRIARASTKRDKVLFSGYHGWSDWYLASNLGESNALDGQLMPGLEPNGVPRGLQGSAIPFSFESLDKLKQTIKGRESEIAAIVVEPARGEDAPKDFLRGLREVASEIGAVLIFDEITTAFRMNAGGIHLRYGVNPDVAVFAKCIANGYAMAAVLGTERVMQASQTTFISSTNWTERVGPTAAIATIKKYIREDVATKIIASGEIVKNIWTDGASRHGLNMQVTGIPTLAAFAFKSEEAQKLNTAFVIEMMKRGFLGFRQFKPSLAHSTRDLDAYKIAVNDVFGEIAKHGAGLLETAPAHGGFFRLTKE